MITSSNGGGRNEESIEKVVKEHTKPEYYSYHTTACPEWGGIYSKTDVIVEQKLPVKIAEWTQFIKNKFKLKPNDRMYIEQTIKRFGLKV